MSFEDCASGSCFGGVCGLPTPPSEAAADPVNEPSACGPPGAICEGDPARACCDDLRCRDGVCRNDAVADPVRPGAPDGGEVGSQTGEGEGEGEGEGGPRENTTDHCDDAVDNDDDGYVDCADKGCTNVQPCRQGGQDREGPDSPAGSCGDGRDNDGDGLADCSDEACQESRECLE